MTKKPTYEELARRVRELEEIALIKSNGALAATIAGTTDQGKPLLNFDLGAMINVEEIQSIMDDFYLLTGMVTAILDLNGNVIESTGWQDICTKFHRIHPGTAHNCTESDLFLAQNLKIGEYVDYKCKNGLTDVVTPLYVGTKHIGNIYTGQFFYKDEEIDEEAFVQRAVKYGFDQTSYLEAFRKIPRYSPETIENLMSFLVKFSTYISKILLTNVQLEQQILERRYAEEEIHRLNRDLELRVRKRTTELEEANKDLEDFVYSISHDLRAPLRSISGFSEIIDRRYKDSLNEEGQHYFDNIIKASRQMGELIDELLKFSRLGRTGIESTEVDLNDIFSAAKETLADFMKKTGASISIPEEMPLILGDFNLVLNVFVNLFDNALKYKREDLPASIDIGFEVHDQYVIISVADNGIGIEPQYYEKIFMMFQRLHSQPEYTGTGIGLAAVKKSVQLMGGQIWVESELNVGSVFKVKLLLKSE